MIDNILSKIVNNAEQKAQAFHQVRADDYDIGGILFCGNCNSAKEYLFCWNGKEKKVPCLCNCEAERKLQEEDARLLKQRIYELRREGLVDPVFGNWVFAKDDGQTPQMRIARKYVENWETMLEKNAGLALIGPAGVGKTFLSSCIGNAILDKACPVLMTSFPRLINELSNFKEDKNSFIRRLNDFKLLIIDDLGVERQSEYALEIVYQVIDGRYKSGLPMIISTNISLDELKNPGDIRLQRIYDRVLEVCLPVLVTGPNRRRAIAGDKLKSISDLLS